MKHSNYHFKKIVREAYQARRFMLEKYSDLIKEYDAKLEVLKEDCVCVAVISPRARELRDSKLLPYEINHTPVYFLQKKSHLLNK